MKDDVKILFEDDTLPPMDLYDEFSWESMSMPKGGKRKGAGRKSRFVDRKSIPVYVENIVLQEFVTRVEYLKEKTEDRTLSASRILEAALNDWVQKQREDDDGFYEWVLRNREQLQKHYGQLIEKIESGLLAPRPRNESSKQEDELEEINQEEE